MTHPTSAVLVCLSAILTSVLGTTTTPAGDDEACRIELKPGTSEVKPVLEKHEAALLILLGFGGFSVVVAVLFNLIRKYVFRDSHSLDTVFDAGGRVTFSLTSVTVTSQMLWPSDFLQNSTLVNKSGICGSVWFGIAIVIAVLMFPMLSLKLKTHAPGAKTFPQIVYARFGRPAHIVFCILALFANLVVTTNLLLAGKTTIEALTKETNTEFIMLILAALFGSYCLIGGLGATFYISYFNAALMYVSVSVFILETTYFATPEVEEKASSEAMYKAMSCVVGPDGNYGNSLLTFRSRSGIIFGVVLMFMATSIQFCDQANWQSRIAAKPSQGIIGFLLASILWFSLPTAISLSAAMSYMSISYQNNMTNVLTQDDINNGYITPFVMERVLGTPGGYLLMSTLMMALMATGSGEVMSISSILVYDIYKTHINPFRKNLRPNDCILCGKDKISRSCNCSSSVGCSSCATDIELQEAGKSSYGHTYTCTEHGMYRHYEDQLLRYKSWIMAIVIVCIIPYGLIISETGINLNWGVLVGPTFCSPFLMPIFLTVWWSKATAKGILIGGIVGEICCLAGMLIMGSTYDGGLDDFFNNTSQDFSLLAGLGTGVVVSFTLSIVISLCTNNIKTHEDMTNEWAKTMNIDNPLHPFRALYKKELDAINAGPIITSDTMARVFRIPQRVAYVGGAICLILFLIVIPAIALSFEILTQDQFSAWLSTFHIYCFVCTVFVVLCPPIQEAFQILGRYKKNKKRDEHNSLSSGTPYYQYDEKPVLNDGLKGYTHM